MKRLFFFALIAISMTTSHSAEYAQELCGEGFSSITPINDWIGDEKKFCKKAICKNDVVEISRERCVSPMKEVENIISVETEDHIKGHNLLSYKGKADFVYIEEGDACFEACKPEEVKKLFSTKTVSGLKRPSCVECFKKRKGEYDNSFEYKEIGKRLYPNQKCYFACRDAKGPIVTSRKLKTECEQCVGLNGHQGEEFRYLKDRHGQCYEIDYDNGKWTVPAFLCGKNKDLMTTTYEWGSSYSVKTILFKQKPDCKEVDVQTGGHFFSRVVSSSFCDTESKDNSDRSIVPDKSSPGKSNSKARSSATKQ